MKISGLLLFFFIFFATGQAQWIRQSVETKAGLRGLSVVSERIVWASGTGGTFLRTTDGGRSWTVGQVPGAEKLDFRDVEAFDADTAYLLSIGEGESSRIYKTTDGGRNWQLQFQNKNPQAFFDAIAFWDRNNGMAMSDPVGGFYYLLQTRDGGQTWKQVGTDKMAPAKDGEAAFAASGTCLITQGKNNVFLVTGGADARVFRSPNRGLSWLVAETPMVRNSPGSGIFSIAMWNEKTGVIVGGDYQKPEATAGNLALTRDGGRTWITGTGLGGYRSGVAYLDARTIIAVGSSGSDLSTDGGRTWRMLDRDNYNAVQARGVGAVWAVGPNGLVKKFLMSRR